MTKELLPLFGEHLDRTISSKPPIQFPLSSVLNFTSKQPTLAVNPIFKHAFGHLEAIAKAIENKDRKLFNGLLKASKEDLGLNPKDNNDLKNDLKARAKQKNLTIPAKVASHKLNNPKPKFA